MKYIVDLWLDGYETDDDRKQAGTDFIEEALDFSGSSVSVDSYDKVERVIADVYLFLTQAPFDFKNGIEYQGIDEGEVYGHKALGELIEKIKPFVTK